MEAKDNLRRITEEHEAKLLKHLDDKLKLLKDERELKKVVNLKRAEPDFEYENDEAWVAHLRNIGMHNLDKEEIMIEKQIEDLHQKVLDRIENDRITAETIKNREDTV